MTERETLRMSILADSDPLGSKRRFGLFSQPITTALGDDGAFRTKIRKCGSSKTQGTRQASLRPSHETSTSLL